MEIRSKAPGILHYVNSLEKNQENIVYIAENQSKVYSHPIPQSTFYNSVWKIEFIMDLSFSQLFSCNKASITYRQNKN